MKKIIFLLFPVLFSAQQQTVWHKNTYKDTLVVYTDNVHYFLSKDEKDAFGYFELGLKEGFFGEEAEMYLLFEEFLKSERSVENYFKNSENAPFNEGTIIFEKICFFDAVNRYRIQNKKKPFRFSRALDKAAQGYADYCGNTNWDQGHRDREGNGSQKRVENVTGIHPRTRENITLGPKLTGRNALKNLTGSEGHCLNLLSDDVFFTGIGFARFKDYWTGSILVQLMADGDYKLKPDQK